MRQIETKIRQQKDVANAARAAGDDVLRRKAQRKITDLTVKYREVAVKSGLETRFERTFVKGFRDIRLQNTDASRIINPLPNLEAAVIPKEKFTEYALNFERSPDKAMAFQEALGYSLQDTDLLIENIRRKLPFYEAIEKPDNGYGRRFEVLMTLIGKNGKTANVKTAWIIDKKTGETRLTSAYVTSKRRRKNDYSSL